MKETDILLGFHLLIIWKIKKKNSTQDKGYVKEEKKMKGWLEEAKNTHSQGPFSSKSPMKMNGFVYLFPISS